MKNNKFSLIFVLSSVIAAGAGELAGCAHSRTGPAKIESSAALAPDLRREIKKLASPDPVVRAEAAVSLGELGTRAEAAIPSLVEMLGDDTRVTLTSDEITLGKLAAEALIKIGERAVPALTACLKSGDGRVRRTAAWALGRLKSPRAVEGLIGALEDEEPLVRRWAVWALWKITRKNFGYNTEEWHRWWKDHMHEYLVE